MCINYRAFVNCFHKIRRIIEPIKITNLCTEKCESQSIYSFKNKVCLTPSTTWNFDNNLKSKNDISPKFSTEHIFFVLNVIT